MPSKPTRSPRPSISTTPVLVPFFCSTRPRRRPPRGFSAVCPVPKVPDPKTHAILFSSSLFSCHARHVTFKARHGVPLLIFFIERHRQVGCAHAIPRNSWEFPLRRPIMLPEVLPCYLPAIASITGIRPSVLDLDHENPPKVTHACPEASGYPPHLRVSCLAGPLTRHRSPRRPSWSSSSSSCSCSCQCFSTAAAPEF